MDDFGNLLLGFRAALTWWNIGFMVVGVLLVTGLWTSWVDAVRIWIEGDSGFRTVI